MNNAVIPEERIHQRTEIRYLIEAESPAIYMARHNWITSNAWDAYYFTSRQDAESWLEENRFHWDKEKSVGVKEWRILDHLFYL